MNPFHHQEREGEFSMSCGPRLWYNKVAPPQSHSLEFRFKEKVNGYSKGINLRYIFRNFLRKKKLIFLCFFISLIKIILKFS